ncbi:hypothetical protein DGN16_13835 [Xanthomonas citri pv. fuscans]|nr:hypothetical protein DGN16_13835 [Xanthomonas citri pv. fuscans]QWN12142.1 hypothetical protein DGN07_11765 [Xanthomonas citri pv. fuscans]
MDYRDPETARRRSIFHQRIQIGFPGRSFVVDLQSYFSSLLGDSLTWWSTTPEGHAPCATPALPAAQPGDKANKKPRHVAAF